MRSNLSVVGSVDYQSCLCHHAPYKDIQIMVLVKAGDRKKWVVGHKKFSKSRVKSETRGVSIQFPVN